MQRPITVAWVVNTVAMWKEFDLPDNLEPINILVIGYGNEGVAAVVYERHIRGFEHRERAGAEQIRFVRSEAVPLFVVEHFDFGVAVRFLGYALVFFPFAGVALDRKSTRLNSSHSRASRMPSSA